MDGERSGALRAALDPIMHILGPAPDPQTWKIRSLELASTVSYDTAALGQIMSRVAADHRSKNGPDSTRLYGPGGSSSVPEVTTGWERHTWRVWWLLPSAWREELAWPNGQKVVVVVSRAVALYYVSVERTLYTTDRATVVPRKVLEKRDGRRVPTIGE